MKIEQTDNFKCHIKLSMNKHVVLCHSTQKDVLDALQDADQPQFHLVHCGAKLWLAIHGEFWQLINRKYSADLTLILDVIFLYTGISIAIPLLLNSLFFWIIHK